MRFYVPVNLLAADYSHVLQGRGVTLYAHTADNCLRLHQQPIPCRLREAAFVLDGLLEHDTELDPRTCYTDTSVVMATAALLGVELAPRIRDIHDQTLYKIDHSQRYPYLDPILTGTIKAHRIPPAWDEVVRLVASLRARVVSPSLALLRLTRCPRSCRSRRPIGHQPTRRSQPTFNSVSTTPLPPTVSSRTSGSVVSVAVGEAPVLGSLACPTRADRNARSCPHLCAFLFRT